MRQLPKSFIARYAADAYALLCDFDGTLAPIVEDPSRARISPMAKRALSTISSRHPVVIVSGRPIAYLRERIALPHLWYAGNHGLEWRFGAVRGAFAAPARTTKALRDVRRALAVLAKRYPGTQLEDKRLSLSFHFRSLSVADRTRLRKDVRAVCAPHVRAGVVMEEGHEFVFNIRPAQGFDKGSVARFALQHMPKGVLPIFIGDDATDEDAFHALRHGITIRVGYRKGSAARYYVRTRRDVDALLGELAAALKRRA